MPSASLRRFAVSSLGLCLALLASHALRAQQAGPVGQPVGPTGTIAGRVTNAATGAPVAGLEIEIVTEVEAYRDAAYGAVRHQVQNVVSAMTGADGRYATKALPVGDYYVRTPNINRFGLIGQIYDKVAYWGAFSFPTRGAAVAVPIQGAAVTVNANRVTSGIDFALEPGGAITGTVRNAATGERVPRAKVTVGQAGPGVETVADADGAYRITGLPSGTYEVEADASEAGLLPALYPANRISGGRPTREPVATVVVKAPAVSAGIDIALQPGGAITGRVTDKATGTPVPGVSITAGRGAGTTDANGDYVVRGLPTDSFEVFARAQSSSGYIDQLYDGVSCRSQGCDLKLGTKVRVTAPETTARIDFKLQRGAQISGRVTNAATGAPVAGVNVNFYPVAGGPLSTSKTDAQGRYISAGLLPGPTYVYTDGYDGVGMLGQVYPGKPIENQQAALRSGTPVTAVEGSTIGGIDFALARGGSISGVVTEGATGAPVHRVRVTADSPQSRVDGVTDAAGRYTIVGLRTGSYLVTARPVWDGMVGAGMKHALFLESLLGQGYGAKDAGEVGREAGTPITVTAPEAVTGIDFALVKGGVIIGTVTNARTGEPVAGIGLSVSGARWSRDTSTDERGRYQAAGLPSGGYTLRTYSDASRSTRSPLRVLDQVYMGVPCWKLECMSTSGTEVAVSAGRTTEHIDFSLAEGGVVSGVITNASTGAPIDRGRVEFYSPAGKQLDYAVADARGRYTSGGLPTGTYFAVGSAGLDSTRGLARQLYKGRPCAGAEYSPCDPKGGTPIVVTAPSTTSGVDFALSAGGTISGVVTIASTGTPVPGARVVVRTGPLATESTAWTRTRCGRSLSGARGSPTAGTSFKSSRQRRRTTSTGCAPSSPGCSTRCIAVSAALVPVLRSAAQRNAGRGRRGRARAGSRLPAPRGRDRIRTSSHRRIVGRARAQCPRVLPLSLRSRRPHGDDRLPGQLHGFARAAWFLLHDDPTAWRRAGRRGAVSLSAVPGPATCR